MQIEITGHHVDITDALRDHVENKFERLKRHFDKVINVHVILTVEKKIQKAEATLHMSGNDVHADASSEDMYASVDAMVDKLDRQIVKHKEKMTEHR
ncbi:ribosomal subunit interface protein [Halothiobacillus diazotrophicus]|uniref:Ribosome hibernation promoting factor n=1 Tax=Halothiobacillus diazotrophicus TaxID=1860122 RepID=A0A191ZE55_9GAMM|nr:ribosome-associated translation inhibitor RaiA [Halothiobacillus diazotrophicus]ANJ66156.1 ribosomal subunit interface protein [Halothiobacillus diazotrophicus]